MIMRGIASARARRQRSCRRPMRYALAHTHYAARAWAFYPACIKNIYIILARRGVSTRVFTLYLMYAMYGQVIIIKYSQYSMQTSHT